MRPGANVAAAILVALAASACSAGAGPSTNETSWGPDRAGIASTSDSWSADVDFARRMIWHHRQDLELASLALRSKSASPQVKQVALQVQQTHDKDLRELQDWLRQWGVNTSGSADHATDGEQYEGAVRSLRGDSGEQFDRQWLTVMLEHSTTTMRVARALSSVTSHADMAALANGLGDTEQGDIAAMQDLLQRY